MAENEGSIPDDIDIRMKVIRVDAQVVITFSHPVDWIKLNKETALALAGKIRSEADKMP